MCYDETHMIHMLIVLAVILLVAWVLFHAVGGIVNLLILGAIVLAAIWLFGMVRGRGRGRVL